VKAPRRSRKSRECANTEGSYRFRYDGLTLVLQSDDQFVLLPRDWTKDDGVAVVLPRSDSVRIEFVRDDAIDSLPNTC
jgi:hypothetical protein